MRPKITSIKFWSDDCANKFRSQFAFYIMTKFDRDVELQWHYFEANHSKGAVDGIGDLVKHFVFRHVLSKKVVIKSPKHFAEYANSILPNISAIFVDNDDSELNFHEECTEKAAYTYCTLQVHFVERLMSDMKCKLKFYMTSFPNNILNEKEYDCLGSLPVVGSYYLVMYNGEPWAGHVTQVKSGGQIVMVKCPKRINLEMAIQKR